MPTLFITEFEALMQDARGSHHPAAKTPSIKTQTVAVAGASAQSTAFDPKTNLVRVCSDVTCSIVFGDNPTATNANMRLPANTVEYFAVNPGQKIAAIANT